MENDILLISFTRKSDGTHNFIFNENIHFQEITKIKKLIDDSYYNHLLKENISSIEKQIESYQIENKNKKHLISIKTGNYLYRRDTEFLNKTLDHFKEKYSWYWDGEGYITFYWLNDPHENTLMIKDIKDIYKEMGNKTKFSFSNDLYQKSPYFKAAIIDYFEKHFKIMYDGIKTLTFNYINEEKEKTKKKRKRNKKNNGLDLVPF